MLKIKVQALCQVKEEKTGKLTLPELPNFVVDWVSLS
jgi:Trm5-related predicted tRNA methylase